MFNVMDVKYEQTGKSKSTNELGMREMQAKAYEARDAQYLLLKAPPASGKSRALMFLALDKLQNQGVKKVIVAVPERSIGSSFKNTNLSDYGFFCDWEVSDRFNLCTAGEDKSKVGAFKAFLASDEQVMVCTHATLRFAFEQTETTDYNDVLLAIDEFHHASANEDNQLGELVRDVIAYSSAHIVAMTGSYFRGDSHPILTPMDEHKFKSVTYNYYQQLNGYEYLKSLGIGYHFYQGKYTDVIHEVLDETKKTIIHIPSPNSGESTKDKHGEVDAIISHLGELIRQDSVTGVNYVKTESDKVLKVADLVWDVGPDRDRIMSYLRNISSADDIDVIIALGMAKEGFDWEYCEHALTVGYRGSLTEIIQIIGRCTRDSENKTHAQFTNLIAQPDAEDEKVNYAVNNMLKAITCSLLMEQVLAPNFKFKRKKSEDEISQGDNIFIRGLKEPSSERVKDIVENDLNDLKADVLNDESIIKTVPGDVIDPEVLNKVLIPKVIMKKYPDLTPEQVEEVRQFVVVDSVVKTTEIEQSGDKRLIKMGNSFINIEELSIDLIDSINPFQKAYEIMSKNVTPKVLHTIQGAIASNRIQMSFEEASTLWIQMKKFVKENGRKPDLNSSNPLEKRMAEAIVYIQKLRRERGV